MEHPDPLARVAAQLHDWAAAELGGAARVREVASLGGHSGVTVGFTLEAPPGSPRRLVLKLPPPGVRATANFDVLRQVPLLRTLVAHGVPAPEPLYGTAEANAFGAPFLVTTRLPGRAFPDLFAAPDAPLPHAEALFEQAVDTLAAIHRIDPVVHLHGWAEPRLPEGEVAHWAQVLRKSSDARWIADGAALAERLSATRPGHCDLGIVHGDFYSNNWLHDGAALTGVVDWESASIGPRLLDLGWICMMYDPEGWQPGRTGLGWSPPADVLVARYASHGLPVARLAWYRALAGYRLACLTAYYYELHRKGKRPNPAWEVLAASFDRMVARARTLLERE